VFFILTRNMSIYTTVFVLISQGIMIMVRPTQLPLNPAGEIVVGDLFIRFLAYIRVGISAASGAGATSLI
jgi:hypothetical protein